ncbi:cation-translocating P-type ATPase [Roseimaritima ulvae]|uniref:Putative cation-transporting ATPase F n=1 Tax=Roseimaritima ulvae TaxID=980254 RepID=A0A5B9R2R2_9BACT|nr:HAD-IC family P-type ATPase [Roseimaritima ulvae]QEG40561.1 putative cation-transporting ATPase F [Roseimaritima ulvae]
MPNSTQQVLPDVNDQACSPPAWHALTADAVTRELSADTAGLRQSEAESRLLHYGKNTLPQPPPTPLWMIALRQFQSPLIYILAIAAVVSVAMGDVKDAGFILGVLVLNALIGSYQEWKAQQSSLALRQLLQIRATVSRNGEVRDLNAEDVVPGDVVWLESGNRVPADLRLLQAHALEVDESLLTGESLPVVKDAAAVCEPQTVVADRVNMAQAGSIVTRGRAKGLVVATGQATNVGQLALDVLADTGGSPPLLVRMERFTKAIAVAVLIAAASIGTLGVALGGYQISEMFLFGVALAVSVIPEGLPVAMTVALAIATIRMARRGLIVRRLTAVEGLGSCTLIATDKTGTLTCNELTVREIALPDGTTFQVSGEGFAPQGDVLLDGRAIKAEEHEALQAMFRAAVLCNEADLHRRDGSWHWHGDAVDIALLCGGYKLGLTREAMLDRYAQANQIPFEPEYQFAASYHRHNGGVTVFVKGGLERVLAMCSTAQGGDLDQTALEAQAIEMAARGYRVLAIADGQTAPDLSSADPPPTPENLRFLGFTAMLDPLRPGVQAAIQDCQRAGVQVSMITGDHSVTALAIARELGLADTEQHVLTGADLDNITPAELAHIVRRIRVFARVAPRQKLQIVEAAKQAGHFVAVTGDGVNDAPALRAANIGVAMGKSGTDVAREAGELVISDDNFATIVSGIEEGRVAYDNIRKVIYLLVSTGAAELVLMTLAVATGSPYLPLLPVQILWLNVVTNGIQHVALALEPNEGGVLQRQPRSPDESIFNQLMIERTVIAALLMGIVGFGLFRWFLPADASPNDAATTRNLLLLLMVLFENFHVGNCRSETKSAFAISPFRSPVLLTGAVVAFLIHFAAMHSGFGQSLLGAEPISLNNWGLLILLALTILPVMELHKWTWRKRHPKATL